MATTSRFQSYTGAPNQDNTGRDITTDFQDLAYAATLALKLQTSMTIVRVAVLTGALTITAETTRPQIGDELTILLLADATGRTVTFSTGFAFSAATLVLGVSKRGSLTAMFDGTSWIETGRSTQA